MADTSDPDPPPTSRGAADAAPSAPAASPVPDPASRSDAGEPQGARKRQRPAMLGSRFAVTIMIGMAVGLILALGLHALLIHGASSWSWLLTTVGGLAVGGACTLFVYGSTTDRTDAGDTGPRGRADVGERGEWRRTLDRRRRRNR